MGFGEGKELVIKWYFNFLRVATTHRGVSLLLCYQTLVSRSAFMQSNLSQPSFMGARP
jgi:hypothetical protein